MSLNALLDSIACDYADIGKAVSFVPVKGGRHDASAAGAAADHE